MKHYMVDMKYNKNMANSDFQVLIDSDAFIGQMYPDDVHHDRAAQIFASLEEERGLLVTTSLVINETATVLSYRQGQPLARAFLELIEQARLPVIHITEEL